MLATIRCPGTQHSSVGLEPASLALQAHVAVELAGEDVAKHVCQVVSVGVPFYVATFPAHD